MMTRNSRALWQVMLLVSFLPSGARAADTRVQVGKSAIDFELEDAYEKTLKLSDTRGQTVVLVVPAEADSKQERQETFKAIRKWADPLKKRYAGKILLLGLAKLDVSFLFKGKAREGMRKNASVRFLIDWDGDAYAPYGSKTHPTIVVIDEKGIVRDLVVGPFDDEKANELFANIDSVLAEK